MSDVFISYARSTAGQANKVGEALRALGYSVWRDDELPAHRAYTDVIEERLRTSKAVVVIWSAEAVKSEWVQSEADHARLDRKLVQLTVDGTTLPMPFDRIQCADLVGWKGDAGAPGWRKVAESVAALVGPPSQDAAPGRASDTARRRGPPLSLSWMVALGAASLAIAALGGWWLMTRPAPPSAAVRVAVLPFDAPGASPGRDAFADGLMDEILGVLSNDHVQTVSRTESAALHGPNADALIKQLGVGLLLDGSVEMANGSITVRAHIDDPAQRAVVWSEAFTRPAAQADALQAEVAAKVARITTQALDARAGGVTDTAVLSDFVIGDEHQRFDPVGFAAAEPYFRRVIAKAPTFAGGHALLAVSEVFQSFQPGSARVEELRADAKREANEAIRLDPKGDDAFVVLSMLTPIKEDFWRAAESPLQTGMARDPDNPVYPYFLGQNFAREGRLRAGAELLRRAIALDAFWPGPTNYLALYLMETGQADESQQLLDRMQRLWPDTWATLSGRFWKEALHGDPDVAAALLADPRTRPPIMDSRSADLWRSSLKALKSGGSGERGAAAAGVRAAADAGQFPPSAAVGLLAQLGDLDGAFEVSDKFPVQVTFYDLDGPPVLFILQTAPMRRDPRFMKLAKKLGLVDYWRSTGDWPDFCAEPGLTYDCKAEAARLGSTSP